MIASEDHLRPARLKTPICRAVGATGTTVTSAGLVLAGTFAVFALVGGRGSGGSQIRDVGVGLAARAGKTPSRTPNPPRHVPANQR